MLVGDRGMLRADSLEQIRAAGYHRAVAEALPRENEVLKEPGPRVGRSRLGRGILRESWCQVMGKWGSRHLAISSVARAKEDLETLINKLRTGHELGLAAQEGLERGDCGWAGTHDELVRSESKRLVAVGAEDSFELVRDRSRKGWIFLEV